MAFKLQAFTSDPIMQRIIEEQQAEQEAIKDRVRDAVHDTVDGQKVANLGALLVAAGVTFEQFAKDVARVKRRRELVDLVAAGEEARSQMSTARAEQDAKRDERNRVYKSLNDEIQMIVHKGICLGSVCDTGRQAHEELLRTADPDLRAQEKEIEQQIMFTEKIEADTEWALSRLRNAAPAGQPNRYSAGISPGPDLISISRAEQQLEQIRQERADLAQSLAELRLEMLIP